MSTYERIRALFTTRYIFKCIITPVGILGNSLTIIILARGRCGLTKCITSYLIAMAAADLLAIFSSMIMSFIFDALYTYMHHTIPCTLREVMIYQFKLKYSNVKTARLVIGTVYTLSLVTNIPYYFSFESYELNMPVGCMQSAESYSVPGWLVFFWFHSISTPLLAFCLILVLNVLTIRHVLMSSKARRKLRGQGEAEKQEDPEMESRRKSMNLLFCLSANFLLLWLTELVVMMYFKINSNIVTNWGDPVNVALNAGDMLKLLSSCTNTFIYAVTQSKIREELNKGARCPIKFFLKMFK
ncbi:probable G-protein coupled receptor 139 [Stegostoma tigrinum]|uniref:probable G-protein coupled receptor 139 n=1 Tax=Stegostoma tigrinum TaxID=3053191 RepID=UPI002870735F|nr:probable G-protein coupled receptor 139 [Stegostoma tigrinum]